MKALAARFPLTSALAITLMAMFCLMWPLTIPGFSQVDQIVWGRVTICLFAILLLTYLGWWRETGFVRPTNGRILVPYLPLALLILLIKLFDTAAVGIHIPDLQMILIGAVVYLGGGFMEEAIFRGLVLRVLLPGGLLRAVLLSSILFALAHALNLLMGAKFDATILQIASSFLMGFAFAAPLATTRNIWPLVIIHGLGNFVGFLNAGGFLDTAATSQAPTLVDVMLTLVPLALLDIYSLWLLGRAGRLSSASPSVGQSARPAAAFPSAAA